MCARPYEELQSLQTPRTKDIPKHWSFFLAKSATPRVPESRCFRHPQTDDRRNGDLPSYWLQLAAFTHTPIHRDRATPQSTLQKGRQSPRFPPQKPRSCATPVSKSEARESMPVKGQGVRMTRRTRSVAP